MESHSHSCSRANGQSLHRTPIALSVRQCSLVHLRTLEVQTTRLPAQRETCPVRDVIDLSIHTRLPARPRFLGERKETYPNHLTSTIRSLIRHRMAEPFSVSSGHVPPVLVSRESRIAAVGPGLAEDWLSSAPPTVSSPSKRSHTISQRQLVNQRLTMILAAVPLDNNRPVGSVICSARYRYHEVHRHG